LKCHRGKNDRGKEEPHSYQWEGIGERSAQAAEKKEKIVPRGNWRRIGEGTADVEKKKKEFSFLFNYEREK